MRTFICLLVLALGVGVSLAEESQRSRAFFNPKVSTRNIALNQLVTVTFTTLRPQVEEVDPESQVLSALAQPAVTASWRVWGSPKVETDPKIGTLRIHLVLLPRTTGTLDLPEIPVRWLSGNQVAQFGKVTVAEHLAHGAQTLPIPDDYQRVGGQAWGSTYEEILEALGQDSGVTDASGELVVNPQPGLDLIIRGGRLASARIKAPGLSLGQARNAFHERWGDSLNTGSGESIQWMLGWVRIEATNNSEQGGTLITLTHEGIESRITRSVVESSVFSLLDGQGGSDQAGDEAPAERPASPVTPTPTVDQEVTRDPSPPAFDPQAEFERQLQRERDSDR